MRNAPGRKSAEWWELADPYLQWAHYTDFRFFRHAHSNRFGILVGLGNDLNAAQHAQLDNADIFIAQHYIKRRFITAALDLGKREIQLNLFAKIGALRMELASPVATPRSPRARRFNIATGKSARLIGMIDDGCPFAHAGLMKHGVSRVDFLWDQGAPRSRCKSTKSAYGYGRYFDREAIADAVEQGTPTGAANHDEDSVYEVAGQDRLRPLASHGAHSLGLAAANVPAKNRISPSRFAESDATEPPSWEPDADADVAFAFVQIPKDSLDDSSGRWLDRNILDGIHALLDYAHATGTVRRATINVSFGPQTGAHDGSSLLERAIDDLVENQDEVDELFVIVPVGNSCQSRAHAEFDMGQGGGEVMWHVPPDSETPAFLEIWLPPGVGLSKTEIKLGSADGRSGIAISGQIVGLPADPWHVITSNAAMEGEPAQWVVLVALGATGGYEMLQQPPHGRWTVSVRPSGTAVNGIAHAYLARNDYNFGGLRRGKPSHLWLADYDPDRFMRSREDDPPAGSHIPAVRICSAGSVSGLATGALSSVAAGYRISDQKPAIYSSHGPSRGTRQGPDWAYPTDESRVFSGLNSWGTRSGASVRLMGTSAAAPQYARDIDRSGKLALPPAYPPEPDPRLGWGRK